MSGTNNSSSNKINVPEAKAALEQYKFEIANEIGRLKFYKMEGVPAWLRNSI